MPARYIRNKKLHAKYRELDEPVPAPVQQIPAVEKEAFQTPVKQRKKGKSRDYMTQGFLQAYGDTP